MTALDCPENGCGIPFPKAEEVVAHLQWDHNRSEVEAERMVRKALESDDSLRADGGTDLSETSLLGTERRYPRHGGGAGSRCHWMPEEDYRDELAKLAGGRGE